MTDRSTEPLEGFNLAGIDPQDQIAPNFKVYGLTKSDLASRLGIANPFPSEPELRAAIHLAGQILQPLRDALGRFTPNSVFRSQALERVLKNKPAGWISTSQHTTGCACDVEIPGMSTLTLAEWARDNLSDYDQIVRECYDPTKGPNSGWVHISLQPEGQAGNRRMLLSYVGDPAGARWVYVQGLTESVP